MNYERISRGLPKEEAARYALGIGLVKAFVNSLKEKNLLPREFTFKKTSGDIKREELARKLGEEWEFLKNYSVIKQHVSAVTSDLEQQKKAGQIEDWRAEQNAFEDDGQGIPYAKERAAYIKPKTQVK